MTDGAPTGSRIRTNNWNQSFFTDTEQAIFSANQIKAGFGERGQHTRITGRGVGIQTAGTNGIANLRAVTGTG